MKKRNQPKPMSKTEQSLEILENYCPSDTKNLIQCRNCEEFGHEATDCYMPNKYINSTDSCSSCYTKGHVADSCPFKEEDEDVLILAESREEMEQISDPISIPDQSPGFYPSASPPQGEEDPWSLTRFLRHPPQHIQPEPKVASSPCQGIPAHSADDEDSEDDRNWERFGTMGWTPKVPPRILLPSRVPGAKHPFIWSTSICYRCRKMGQHAVSDCPGRRSKASLERREARRQSRLETKRKEAEQKSKNITPE